MVKGKFGASSKQHLETYIDTFYLKAELRLEYENGKEVVITTDDSWKCKESPVISDSIYDGEVYDERKAITDWSCADFCDETWEQMSVLEDVKLGQLKDRLSLPIIIKETIKPIGVIT